MRGARWTLIIVLLCLLVPILAIFVLTRLPPEWVQLAKDFQTLIGASVALGAAIIAFANVQVQIASARDLELDKQTFERRQIASALIGELSAFVAVANARDMVAYYQKNAEAVKKSGTFEYWSLALSPAYDKMFGGLGAKVGMLGNDLPEQVVRVYAMISGVFDRMAAAEKGTYAHLTGDSAARIIELIAEEADEAIRQAGAAANSLRRSR